MKCIVSCALYRQSIPFIEKEKRECRMSCYSHSWRVEKDQIIIRQVHWKVWWQQRRRYPWVGWCLTSDCCVFFPTEKVEERRSGVSGVLNYAGCFVEAAESVDRGWFAWWFGLDSHPFVVLSKLTCFVVWIKSSSSEESLSSLICSSLIRSRSNLGLELPLLPAASVQIVSWHSCHRGKELPAAKRG